MKSKLLRQTADSRSFAIIFDQDDEALTGLHEFAEREKLAASSFTAVGAFKDVTLGWFDWDQKDYKKIPIHEQVEVLALVGDVSMDKGKRKVHAHVVVGTSTGEARGGHLLDAHVRPTLEVFLTESNAELRRAYDPHAQIALIQTT